MVGNCLLAKPTDGGLIEGYLNKTLLAHPPNDQGSNAHACHACHNLLYSKDLRADRSDECGGISLRA
jgi:hypothetical protein